MPKKRKFLYDPENGILYRQAGCVDSRGYIHVQFEGRRELAHRVAWFLYYGEWPQFPIDHINGIRSDNRIINLRLATCSENGRNRRKSVRNTSGHKGVSRVSRNGKWQAQICTNGQPKYLGTFTCREKAAEAYAKAALEFHGEFVNLDL